MGVAKGGLGKLKDLMELAGQVDMEDIRRFRTRAENIERLLADNNKLLREILHELKELNRKIKG